MDEWRYTTSLKSIKRINMKASEVVDYTSWCAYRTYALRVTRKMEASRRLAITRMVSNINDMARPLVSLEFEWTKHSRQKAKDELDNIVSNKLLPSLRTLERMMLVAKLSQR